MQAALDRAVPQAQVLVRGLVQGPPVSAPLEMRLVGPGLQSLRSLGEEARRRIAELPTVTHTRADLIGGAPKLVFDLDQDKVRLAGLELADIARQLQTLVEGAEGGSLIEGSEELAGQGAAGQADRSAAERIAGLVILPPMRRRTQRAARFRAYRLRALGELRIEPSRKPDCAAQRRTREHGAGLPAAQCPAGRGARDLQSRLDETPLDLPDGYRIEWGGDSDARSEVVRNLTSTLGLVVALTVAAILLTFNSWRLSMVAFVVCGLSMGLSLLALAVFQYPFGIQALIGVIGSIGVSINAAIIIMTALQQDEGAARGDRDSIRRVVLASSRHIVSTTVTTFGGFLPLILEGGGFWPPFAMAIAGGVLLSTVVSFYFVPPMFSLLVDRRARRTTGHSLARRGASDVRLD